MGTEPQIHADFRRWVPSRRFSQISADGHRAAGSRRFSRMGTEPQIHADFRRWVPSRRFAPILADGYRAADSHRFPPMGTEPQVHADSRRWVPSRRFAPILADSLRTADSRPGKAPQDMRRAQEWAPTRLTTSLGGRRPVDPENDTRHGAFPGGRLAPTLVYKAIGGCRRLIRKATWRRGVFPGDRRLVAGRVRAHARGPLGDFDAPDRSASSKVRQGIVQVSRASQPRGLGAAGRSSGRCRRNRA